MNLRSIPAPALALFVASLGPAVCRADVLYTFEAPQFTIGEPTPIGPTAPNIGDIGDPGFTTSFAAAGDPGGAVIESGFPSTLFSGQFLITEAPGALTLTFNKPVFALDVNFALDAPNGDSGAFLEAVAGSSSVEAGNLSPASPFAGGNLGFSSATEFTSVTLDGFTASGAETPFAIDDLDVSPVPEPSFLPLLGVALAGLVFLSQRLKWSEVSAEPLR